MRMAVGKEEQTLGGHRIHTKPVQKKQFPAIIVYGNADFAGTFLR